jgi:eukaryotic-like serine/threonine-protein kinase
MVGGNVSHYQILEEIGRGGMGVVYKALDTHLDRFVAIKILPPDKLSDPERKRRFIQEAKSASALNHPNIVTIYDIDATDRTIFIAMEYIKGRALNRVIPPNGLAPGKALEYAVQIADALAALHTRGIIHRDLKPANVMVLENSTIKILDFGLAKLTDFIADEKKSAPASEEQTSDGVVVGTPAYMAPEQIEGKTVDSRADIFSFGVLMYEMLAGLRPFQGENQYAIATAVLSKDPISLTHINSATPAEIERTVSRCLQKDPQLRFQNAADLKVALEWLGRDIESGKLHAIDTSVRPIGKKRVIYYALGFMLTVLAIAGAAIYWLRPGLQMIPEPKRITSDVGLTTNPALSRDGKLLAYASDRGGEGNLDIWLQQLSGGQPIRRTHDPTDEENPEFSPDGNSIVFSRAGSGIFVIPALAGGEMQVTESGVEPRFSPDGTQIAYWVGDQFSPDSSGKIFITPLGHGAPAQIAADFADAKYPRWAPNGTHVLFQGVRYQKENPEWWVVPIGGGPAINTGILNTLRKRGMSPLPGPGDWKRSGLLFSALVQSSQHIYAANIRIPGFHLADPITQITVGTGMEGDPSISTDGKIALAGWHYNNNLWRVMLQAVESSSPRIEQISATGAFDTLPSISADGRKLAFLSRRSGSQQVWIRDMDKGGESVLTIGTGEKSAPVMASDGSMVAYSIMENGKPCIYAVPTDSSRPGGVRRVCDDCGAPSDWTRKGCKILYTSGVPQRVYLFDLSSGTSVPLLQHPSFNLDQPHVSPDNHWIAFAAQVGTDRARIFVAPFRNATPVSPGDWIAVTDGNSWDDKPRWLGDDSLIFYSDRDHFGCIWRQRLKADSMQPAGLPSALQHFHELRRSPRTLYRRDFEITAARNSVILNLVESSGNIWLTSFARR